MSAEPIGLALPPERCGTAAPEGLARTRAAIDAAPPPWPPHPRIVGRASERGGITCLEFEPAAPRLTIAYLHGGGYRLGRCEGWAGFAAVLAERLSARIILPEYRLAPEHPFPAALHDVLLALDDLSRDGPVIVAGDSAGGGLAVAATLVAARPPVAAILLSPWLDLTLAGESFESNASCDRFFPRASAVEAAGQYLQGHPADDPLASPLFADLRGFPPSLVLAGGHETLLDDATCFARRLALSGSCVELHVAAGMQHVWPVVFPDLPETEGAIAAMVRFVGRFA